MEPVQVTQGSSPLVLAFPHVGTYVPDDIFAALNGEGRLLRDTDWHIHHLYDGLIADVTTVTATFHRYVIDANRDPSGQSLYPGQTTTGLVPLTTFDNVPIWSKDPTEVQINEHLATYHATYHAALAEQLDRVREIHGYAVLYDCHSIRSVIPWLFEGTLSDFNIGTDSGKTCDPAIEAAVHQACLATGRTTVLNGRFRGGWTTRHYGRPDQNIHAVQMELAQITHLANETPPFDLSADRSAVLRPQLKQILTSLLSAAQGIARKGHSK